MNNQIFPELARLTKLAVGKQTLMDFAKKSKVSYSSISKLVSNHFPSVPNKKTLLKIALASEARVTFEQLLIAAGYDTSDVSKDLYSPEQLSIALEDDTCDTALDSKPHVVHQPYCIFSDDIKSICAQIYDLISLNNEETFTVIILAQKLNTLSNLKLLQQNILQTQNNIIIQYALILE